uniref:zinc finger protein AEBP2 isoform X2 n=1 Tax=Myxine glutinosa TaxID=7769 RepID=UPI00358FB88B
MAAAGGRECSSQALRECSQTASRRRGMANCLGRRGPSEPETGNGFHGDTREMEREMEEESASSFPDVDSTGSSGRSTPALRGAGCTGSGGVTPRPPAPPAYPCCWDQCQAAFSSSPDLADHIREAHVARQGAGEVYVCLWKSCKVYNTPSSSRSWLHRHVLSHSGDKPFKCVIDGCTATFASQMGLARHVPTHFSSGGTARLPAQPRAKDESPGKAGGGKRRRQRGKRRFSLPKPDDFFDSQTMDMIRHRLVCFNLATQLDSQGGGNSVVFNSTVVARRKDESGKVKVLLHWMPEDILPDVWVSEGECPAMKTKKVHLSRLPPDTLHHLDPSIYRSMPRRRARRKSTVVAGSNQM